MGSIDFSFIIPHKNIPELLRRCLGSIPHKENIQIIVVDDNSDPNKVDFEKFPGIGEECVEVYFTKEGKGAGYARNVGLEHAEGKWLIFADADDYFSNNINKFIDEYVDSQADVVYLFNKTIDMQTGDKLDIDEVVPSLLMKCNVEGHDFDILRYKCYPPWTKMIRKDLVDKNNIKFDETIASNDVKFSVYVGAHSRIIEICPFVIYIRNIRQGSLQYSLKKEILLSRINVGYDVNSFLESIGKLEYYVDILGHILRLRRISFLLFIKQLCIYLTKSQYLILNKCLQKMMHKILRKK